MPSMLAWTNLADIAQEITATREATGLGVRNLLTEPLAEVWRVPAVAAGATTDIQVTLAAPASIGVVAVFAPRDSYLPPAYQLRVMASLVSVAGSEVLNTGNIALNLTAGRGASWYWPATPFTAQFLRLRFTAGTGDEYLQLGRLWLGPDCRPAIQASRAGQVRGVMTAGLVERAAVSGIVSAQRGATSRAARFTPPLLTPAAAVQVETAALAVGTHGQVIANPRTQEGPASLLLGRFATPPQPEIAAPTRWSASITVLEDL